MYSENMKIQHCQSQSPPLDIIMRQFHPPVLSSCFFMIYLRSSMVFQILNFPHSLTCPTLSKQYVQYVLSSLSDAHVQFTKLNKLPIHTNPVRYKHSSNLCSSLRVRHHDSKLCNRYTNISLSLIE